MKGGISFCQSFLSSLQIYAFLFSTSITKSLILPPSLTSSLPYWHTCSIFQYRQVFGLLNYPSLTPGKKGFLRIAPGGCRYQRTFQNPKFGIYLSLYIFYICFSYEKLFEIYEKHPFVRPVPSLHCCLPIFNPYTCRYFSVRCLFHTLNIVFFSKIVKYIPDSGLSRFSVGVHWT